MRSETRRSTRRAVPLATSIAAALLCGSVHAQIRTDGSVGAAAQTLAGPSYVIPQTLGRLSGANLFHSFQTFNIGSNESATFTTSSAGIANVISRVTGGSPSLVNGTLRLSAAVGAPDFFFINPAGIAFGKGAAIDVPGAFHVGTADYVKFSDGRFYADPQKASSFSSAAPEAFGFLGTSRAPVLVNDGAQLVTRRTHGISVVGGDIGIDGGSLAAGAAEIRLAAVGRDTVEVGFTGDLPAASGLLDMRNKGSVTSYALDGLPGGRIVVSAGDMAMDTGSYLYSTHFSEPIDAAGAGGDIVVAARNYLTLANGASISSDATGTGGAGSIRLQSSFLTLGTEGYVDSTAYEGSVGRPGAIRVDAAGGVGIGPHSGISTNALGTASGQSIAIRAGSLGVDGGFITARGTADTGSVAAEVGALNMAHDGRIGSITTGSGNAGSVRVRAASLFMDTGSFIGSLGSNAKGGSGAVDVAVMGQTMMTGGASILSSTGLAGDAGSVSMSAGSLYLDNSSITSNTVVPEGTPPTVNFSSSGSVTVNVVESLVLRNNSNIDASTATSGNAGSVQVRARDVNISGASFINSRTLQGSGNSGSVDVAVSGQLLMNEDSRLSTSADNFIGNSGSIRVSAGALLLNGASIVTNTSSDSVGRGGDIQVTVSGSIAMQNGGSIKANAQGIGRAGDVRITTGGLAMDSAASISSLATDGSIGDAGQVSIAASGDVSLRNGAYISSDGFGVGRAGGIDLGARNVLLDSAGRISSVSYYGNVGDAGQVNVRASGELALLNSSGRPNEGAQISTSTFSVGNGGAVNVRAGSLRIDGLGAGIVSFGQTGSVGNGGNIDVLTTGNVRVANGGGINASSSSVGDGGAVKIVAANVTVDGGTITSEAGSISFGRAGTVSVEASGDLQVLRGGVIGTSTRGPGVGGSVQAQAARILIDGEGSNIQSASIGQFSSGQVGNVQLTASERITVSGGAVVAISNDATAFDSRARQPATLQVSAPDIVLRDGALTAASFDNIAAAGIDVTFGNSLRMDRSAITTTANNGNGGAIRISGGNLLYLHQSAVTTSVLGTQGNGGNIDVNARSLVLDNGFVQANTVARNATGGLVRIHVGSLVASGNTLFLGGDRPYPITTNIAGFNVIQAAAPTGLSGVVDVTSPVLDITGSLRGLRADVIDAGGLGRSLCQTSGGSTLAQAGRGGLAASSRGLLRAEQGEAGARADAGGGLPLVLARIDTGGCL